MTVDPAEQSSASTGARTTVDVSVIIPTYNAANELPAQLEALAQQQGDVTFEVIVADNGSTDNLPNVVAALASSLPYSLRIVDASGTRGVAHARNVGCDSAVSGKLLICDADDRVSTQWVRIMSQALDVHPIVGGTLVSTELNTHHVQQWRPMYAAGVLPMKLGHLRYAVGANTGLRREVFEALGGWDETFVAGGDDVEFSWRAQHAGFELSAAPEAIIHYKLRDSLSATIRQSYHYATSDALLLASFRGEGVVSTGWKSPLRECRWLIKNVGGLRSAGSRGLWLRRGAMLAGRIRGSLRHRVWAL